MSWVIVAAWLAVVLTIVASFAWDARRKERIARICLRCAAREPLPEVGYICLSCMRALQQRERHIAAKIVRDGGRLLAIETRDREALAEMIERRDVVGAESTESGLGTA